MSIGPWSLFGRRSLVGLLSATVLLSLIGAAPAAASGPPFVVVNSASYEGSPVSYGGFLTIYTASPVTDEQQVFTPWRDTTPRGLYVQTDRCLQRDGSSPVRRLPITYVGPSGYGGTQINVYYPNDYEGGVNREPFICMLPETVVQIFTVVAAPGFGPPVSQLVQVVLARPGIFMAGNAPAGYHVNVVTRQQTPWTICNSDTTGLLCPVATNGQRNRVVVFTTGAELYGCPEPDTICPPPLSPIGFSLTSVTTAAENFQIVESFGFAGQLGVEQGRLVIGDNIEPGDYRLRVYVFISLPGSSQSLPLRLGRPNFVKL